jgi:hypothetical protein
MTDWREQEAKNETVFREFNEWTRDGLDTQPFGIDDAYLCECSDRRCTDPIRLTRAEYDAVRSVSVRFAIALNHENPEIDSLVEENARFATVDKFYGAPGRIARSSDPRR